MDDAASAVGVETTKASVEVGRIEESVEVAVAVAASPPAACPNIISIICCCCSGGMLPDAIICIIMACCSGLRAGGASNVDAISSTGAGSVVVAVDDAMRDSRDSASSGWDSASASVSVSVVESSADMLLMREDRSRVLALSLGVSSIVLSVVARTSSVVAEDELRKEDRKPPEEAASSSVDVSSPPSVVVKDSSDDPARRDEKRAAPASSTSEVSSTVDKVDDSPREVVVVVVAAVDKVEETEEVSSTLTPLSWAMSSRSFISRPYLARKLTMSSGASPTPPDMYSALASSRRRWRFAEEEEEPARRPPAFWAVPEAGEVEKEKSRSKSNVLDRVVAAPTAQAMVPAKRTRLRRSRPAAVAAAGVVMEPPPPRWDGMAEGAYFCRLRLLLWRDRLVPAAAVAAAGEKREVERCVMLASDDCEESSVYICCWELMVARWYEYASVFLRSPVVRSDSILAQ